MVNTNQNRITVSEHACETCGTKTVIVSHQTFPELRLAGSTAEKATQQLIQQLTSNLGAVSDPDHRRPVESAIADLQASLVAKENQ